MRPVAAIAVGACLGLAAGLFVARAVRRGDVRGRSPAAARFDQRTDEALVETFPASDPSAATASLISGAPARLR